MIMTLSRSLVALIVAAWLTGLARAEAAEEMFRLAVLPEDSAVESRSVADLMTVELGKQAKVELVDRAEIERVLTEQKLSASGLLDAAQRISVGKLLRADGLVLLGTDRKRGRLLTRVVETRHGYLAGLFTQELKATALAKVARDGADRIVQVIPKLRLNPSERMLVSLWRFGNATGLGSSEPGWVETEFPLVLTDLLSRDPKILLLERRQLGVVVGESQVAADARTDLKASGIVIDGELTVALGVPLGKEDTPVTFVIRLRDAGMREVARISQQGKATALDSLYAETALAIQAALHRMTGVEGSGNTADETAALLAFTRSHMAQWSAEAAFALTPTNRAAREGMVKALIKRGGDDLERAKAVAEAERMCRESGLSLSSSIGSSSSYWLSEPRMLMDPEIREILQPVRRTLRREVESWGIRFAFKIRPQLEYAPAFFDNPLDTMLYTRSLFDTIYAVTNKVELPCRYPWLVEILDQSAWTPELVESLTNSPDPVLRYFSSARLLRYQPTSESRERLARQAYSDMGDALKQYAGWYQPLPKWTMDGVSFSCDSFRLSVRNITNACPDLCSPVNELILTTINDLAARKDFTNLACFGPRWFWDGAEPESVVRWAEWIEACERSWPTNAFKGWSDMSPLISSLRGLKRDLTEQYHIDPQNKGINGTGIFSRVLLSSDDPRWKQTAGTLWPKDQTPSYSTVPGIVPQRLLLDGDTAWIALGGGPLGNPYLRYTAPQTTGLMHMDLKSGKILSCRYGTVDGDWVGNWILPLFRWKNYIVVGQPGIGVLLFPVDASGQRAGFDGVTVVGVKEGLLSQAIFKVAALEDSLFVEMDYSQVHTNDPSLGPVRRHANIRNALMEWNSRTRTASLIADVSIFADSSEMTGLGADGVRKKIDGLYADSSNRTLHVACTLFERRESGNMADPFGQAVWAYHLDSKSWTCVSSNRWKYKGSPPRVPVNTPALKALPPDLEGVRDAQNWDDGTLVISGRPMHSTGYFQPAPGNGRDWKIEHFTLESVNVESRAVAVAGIDHAPKLIARARPMLPPIIEAARAGDVQGIEALVAAGADIDARDQSGATPLRHAVVASHREAALWLIRHGADVNLADTALNRTPLMRAAMTGQDEVVRELLERKADVNCRNAYGCTALHFAAESGRLGLYNLLIEHGASPDDRGHNGCGPLTHAAWSPHSDVLKALLEKKVLKVHLNDALFRAVEGSSTNAINNVALLLKHGADLTATSSWGAMMPSFAAEFALPDTLRFLLQQGLPVNGPKLGRPPANLDEDFPLYIAMYKNRALNARVLLEAGAELSEGAQWLRRIDGRLIPQDEQNQYMKMDPKGRPDVRGVYQEALGKYILRTFEGRTEPANLGK